MNMWWVYLAPQNISSAIVVLNCIVIEGHCFNSVFCPNLDTTLSYAPPDHCVSSFWRWWEKSRFYSTRVSGEKVLRSNTNVYNDGLQMRRQVLSFLPSPWQHRNMCLVLTPRVASTGIEAPVGHSHVLVHPHDLQHGWNGCVRMWLSVDKNNNILYKSKPLHRNTSILGF